MKAKSFFLFLLLYSVCVLGQDGKPDYTFSMDGKAYASVPQLSQWFSKTFVQENGKVVIAGRTAYCCGYNFAVARFNVDGTLDSTFDNDGVVITGFPPNLHNLATTVTVQPDGKIIAAGMSNLEFALARYNVDGTLDSTFDGDGKVLTNVGGSGEIYSILLLPDGKILVGGNSVSSTSRFTLARYNSNGSLDATFGTNGIAAHSFLSGNHTIYSIATQKDGKIVAAGSINGDFAVVRYSANGTPDQTFGFNGKFVTDFYRNEIAYSVAIQRDGKIIAAGVSGSELLVMRMLPNGNHDNSFDDDGIIKTTYGSGENTISSIMLQDDEKIVIAGSSRSTAGGDYLVVRYLSDGRLDPTFDDDGFLTLDMGASEAYATVTGWNNRLIIGGFSGDQFAVARLINSSNPYVLPLRLISFTGQAHHSYHKLLWTTASEINTRKFQVERGDSSLRFTLIGEVAAIGNNSKENTYHFKDNNPLIKAGYYRLKMIDKDEKFKYSSVVILNKNSSGTLVFNNPVLNDLLVQVTLYKRGKITIINSAGAVVKQQTIEAGAISLTIAMNDLASGIYRIVLESMDGIVSKSFLKK